MVSVFGGTRASSYSLLVVLRNGKVYCWNDFVLSGSERPPMIEASLPTPSSADEAWSFLVNAEVPPSLTPLDPLPPLCYFGKSISA